MENGHAPAVVTAGGGDKLADKLSGLKVNDDDHVNNDSLFQVMKAVEAAEATIKQQAEENTRLRAELQSSLQRLQKYKSEDTEAAQRPLDVDSNQNHQSIQSHHDSFVPKHDVINGTFKAHVDTTTSSHLSSPSTTSFSPSSTRHHIDGNSDARFNLPSQGLLSMTQLNDSTSLWKQDLLVKIREREEEILQLRKHLADYSVKESQIRNDKYVLEKRIAYMRLAFDQQQQDLVDAASKALSYRQDIIEENIHLAYQLQAAQQERSTFVQCLMPLLAEYSLQPPTHDAQSIVSNVKKCTKKKAGKKNMSKENREVSGVCDMAAKFTSSK